MEKIGFIIDSTLNINNEEAKQLGIIKVPLKVIIDGVEYVDGNFDFNYVIKGLQDKKMIRTSQPSPDQFIQAINDLRQKGFKHVIILTLSQTLSGTFNSANLAKSMLENKEGVYVIDTQSTISGGAYIVKEAHKFAASNKSIEEVLKNIETNINRGSLIFTVDNLSVLVKNGRLSRVSGLIGNVLRIKPILRFALGELVVEHKARGNERVIEYIVNEVKKVAHKDKVVVKIEYVDFKEQAHEVLKVIKENYPNVEVELTGRISPVVAAHVGLGALGLYIYSY